MKKTKENYFKIVKMTINFVNWLFGETTKDSQLKKNSIVNLLMSEKDTEASIQLFYQVKQQFEKELTEIKSKAILEKNCVNDYFRIKSEMEINNLTTNFELIKN